MERGVLKLPREPYVVFSLITLFMLAFAFYILRPGGLGALTAFGNGVYVLFAVIAAIFGFAAVRLSGTKSSQGKLLLFLALAVAADAVAGLVWFWYEIVRGVEPFPSFADAIWILYYVFAIIGFGYALLRVRKFLRTPLLIISFAVWGVITAFVLHSTLARIFADESYSALEKLLSAMYPAGDLSLLLLIFLLFTTLRRGAFGTSLAAFLLAFTLTAVGDLIFSYQSWTGVYETGSMIDLFWLAGQLLIAYGFFLQLKTFTPSKAVQATDTAR